MHNGILKRQVSLLSWRLQSGGLATAFLARTTIAAGVAVPGTAVRTAMGPATVELVREDGVAVVVAGGAGGTMSAANAGSGAGAAVPPSSSSGDRVRYGKKGCLYQSHHREGGGTYCG